MNRNAIILSLALIAAYQAEALAGPFFWVKCSSCEVTQTNTLASINNTLFSCGTGQFPGTFRVLVQCKKIGHLATLNLLQAEYDLAVAARRSGETPNYVQIRKSLQAVAKAYQERTASVTNGCPSCKEPLNIIYFPFTKLPESGEPEQVRLPLSAHCPACGSNTLQAVSTGVHFD